MSVGTRRAWLDLETTGLEPKYGRILEIGLVITEGPEYDVLAAKSWVMQCDDRLLSELCDPKVTAMHQKSGLWEACMSTPVPRMSTWGMAMSFLEGYCPEPSPMCGASVHFDRAWLKHHHEGFEKMFHYRNFDVSTYRTAMADLGMKLPPKREIHRPIYDLMDSIQLARWAATVMRVGYEKAAAMTTWRDVLQ